MVKVTREKLGANIRRLREERGWSVEEMAERTGATAAFVKDAEAGKKKISLKEVMTFCMAFGVSPNELFDNILESK